MCPPPKLESRHQREIIWSIALVAQSYRRPSKSSKQEQGRKFGVVVVDLAVHTAMIDCWIPTEAVTGDKLVATLIPLISVGGGR